jgi:hypothetical protein
MTSLATTTPQWRRVLLAATRLAALYAVGVTLLLIPLYFLLGDPFVRDWSRLIKLTTVPFAVLFAVAFVLLAVARRVGFAVLWLLQLAWWAVLLRITLHVDAPSMFIVWTPFALPLYVLGALGTREAHRSAGRGWRIVASGLPVAVWIGMLLLGYPFGSHGSVPDWAARLLWAPAPFVIAVLSTAGFWVGTRRSTSSAV